MMYSILLLLAFLAAANAHHCFSCEEIACLGGTCRNDKDGCAQCKGRIVPPKPKPPKQDRVGPCVEECDSGLNPGSQRRGCKQGYECRSNGCGHTCQKINKHQPSPRRRGRVGPCVEACDSGLNSDSQLPGCPEGYECRSNGCGYTCQKLLTPQPSPRREDGFGICVEECDSGLNSDSQHSGCREGYECRSNGCGHTCQKINTLGAALLGTRVTSVGALTAAPLGTRVTSVGPCVEACDSGLQQNSQLPGCQEGYECRSNGCGHTCQKIDTDIQRRQVGPCVELCGSGCQEGYECRSNGCGHTCQKVFEGPIFGVCAELCGEGCQEGYECRSNGCGHSCQKVFEEPIFGPCVELCGDGCPEGQACLSNGCGHSCQPVKS